LLEECECEYPGLLETEKTHRIPYLANRPGTKKLLVATIDRIIYFVDYEKFDDQQNIWDLTVLKKTLCSVHILTENMWSVIFREIVVFYDPKERLFLYIPPSVLFPFVFVLLPFYLPSLLQISNSPSFSLPTVLLACQ
jgi:hypothetical protein